MNHSIPRRGGISCAAGATSAARPSFLSVPLAGRTRGHQSNERRQGVYIGKGLAVDSIRGHSGAFMDNRTLEQREAAIRYHRRRIQDAFRILRAAGLDPVNTPAEVADDVLKKNVFILKKGIDT